MIRTDMLRNPVWERSDNLRDPAVLPVEDGYLLYYSRYSNSEWSREENWAIACVHTTDFVEFTADHDISPKGYASPGDPVRWHGRYLLPFQRYPTDPARLCVSESGDGRSWNEPRFILDEANSLRWNTRRRVIDPAFVVSGEVLHCFFVGSAETETPGKHANLLGHAVTTDPALHDWRILTREAPLIGRSEHAYDGVENVTVFNTGDFWIMIYSEGLADQHLALARSDDLVEWRRAGRIDLPTQRWMSKRYGAPFVWHDEEAWTMILMGEDDRGRTTFGLLSSDDGISWNPLPEKPV